MKCWMALLVHAASSIVIPCTSHCTASDRVIGLSAYQSVSLPVDTKVSIFERIRNTCSWKPRFHSSSYNACTIFSVVTYKL